MLHTLSTPTAYVQIADEEAEEAALRDRLTLIATPTTPSARMQTQGASLSKSDVRSLRDTLSRWLDGEVADGSQITARPKSRRRRRT